MVGKIYERILKEKIQNHIDEHKIVPYSQKGFRPPRSTQIAHPYLQTESARALNSGIYMMSLC